MEIVTRTRDTVHSEKRKVMQAYYGIAGFITAIVLFLPIKPGYSFRLTLIGIGTILLWVFSARAGNFPLIVWTLILLVLELIKMLMILKKEYGLYD